MRLRILTRVTALASVLFLMPAIASAGSQTFSTPGSHTFTVPSYAGSLIVDAWGGGGGGGTIDCPGWQPGAEGGSSSFDGTVVARGGIPGYIGAGTGGTASGGDINTAGAAGSGSNGGTAPLGGAGGAGANFYGGAGGAPGGGGGAANFGFAVAGGAGSGAYAKKTYSAGALVPGSDVSIVVGRGGRGGIPVGCIGASARGGKGGDGRVRVSWTDAPPPPPPPPTALSCNITVTPSSISSGDHSDLAWTFTAADAFNITWAGWQSAPGHLSVSPSATTTYTGTAYHCTSGTLDHGTLKCKGGGGGGSQTFSMPGTYQFDTSVIPADSTVTVTVNGAGGGGASDYYGMHYGYNGSAGAASRFNGTVIGNGGGGGLTAPTCAAGSPGTASGGGDSNTTGGGAAGGAAGAGTWCGSGIGGGAGGRAVSTYASGVLSGTVAVVVGAGGSGGAFNNSTSGSPGSDGSVTITWTGSSAGTTDPQTATCSATLTVTTDHTCPPGQKWNGTACVPGTLHKPTITPIGACIVGEPQTYTVQAFDDDTTSTIHYGFDWTGTGPVTQWVPTSGFVAQGTPQTVTHTWTTAGTHTFRALAEDSHGNQSAWSDTKTVNCAPGTICTPAGSYCGPETARDKTSVCRKTGTSCTETCSPCAWGCTDGACNPAPAPNIVTWKVTPKLVHKHDTTSISWTVQNVSSCTVTGSNGDSWTVAGTGNPKTSAATRTSSGIVAQTVYTLHCIPFPSASWTDQTATVNVVPVFREQ